MKGPPSYQIGLARFAERERLPASKRRAKMSTDERVLKPRYFDMDAWAKCAAIPAPRLKSDLLKGRCCVIGLSIPSPSFVAVEILILPVRGHEATLDDPYLRIGEYFVSADLIRKDQFLSDWHTLGVINATGAHLVKRDVRAMILEASKRFDVSAIAYDPHEAPLLAADLMAAGLPMVGCRPMVANFSNATKRLKSLIERGEIRHSGCPVMAWQMANVAGPADSLGNVFPVPAGPVLRITSPDALISALAVALGDVSRPTGARL